ncbi:1926_t:CDS:2, partial [Funneliformis geosporum]
MSFYWFQQLANQNDGIEKDLRIAFYWYQKSANQNDGNVQYNLTICYQNIWGIKKDLKMLFY